MRQTTVNLKKQRSLATPTLPTSGLPFTPRQVSPRLLRAKRATNIDQILGLTDTLTPNLERERSLSIYRDFLVGVRDERRGLAMPLEEVFLAGENFQEDASLIVGSSVVTGTFLNENAISFISPAQEAPGLVDVQILNPNGLDDTRLGALLYVENPNPQEPSSEVGVDDGDTGLSADDTATTDGEKPGTEQILLRYNLLSSW